MDKLTWFKSAYSSANGQCVECARTPGGGMAVRDSKRPADAALAFTPEAWSGLLTTIRETSCGIAARR